MDDVVLKMYRGWAVYVGRSGRGGYLGSAVQINTTTVRILTSPGFVGRGSKRQALEAIESMVQADNTKGWTRG